MKMIIPIYVQYYFHFSRAYTTNLQKSKYTIAFILNIILLRLTAIMSSKEEEMAVIVTTVSLFYAMKKRHQKIKGRRWWVKPWIDRSLGNLGILRDFINSDDPRSYTNFLRMDEKTFKKLLVILSPRIKKCDTHLRQCIPVESVLVVTLRYLATGESFRSLMYNYRISESAISNFVPKVCSAIFEELKETYLKVPCTVSEWQRIAHEFEESWNLPNILGAMDGKHITIKAPSDSGSLYFNYKKQHSIVLLALVDAHYNFTYINVGMNGRISDGGIYRQSNLSTAIEKNLLNFPEDCPLPSRHKPVPFVIAADAAFPLSTHIIKPYPMKGMSKEQQIFNYRISRVRRVVENTFGILANRFRVILNVNALQPEKVKVVTLACCALHNFLSKELNAKYMGADVEQDIDRNQTLSHGLTAQVGNRASNAALATRHEFMEYVNSVGAVPWQNEVTSL